jgi:hypothetical protein
MRRTLCIVLFGLNVFCFVSRSPAPITIEPVSTPTAKSDQGIRHREGLSKSHKSATTETETSFRDHWERVLIGTWELSPLPSIPANFQPTTGREPIGTITFFRRNGGLQAEGSYSIQGKIPRLYANRSANAYVVNGTISGIRLKRNTKTDEWVGGSGAFGNVYGQFYWNYAGVTLNEPDAEIFVANILGVDQLQIEPPETRPDARDVRLPLDPAGHILRGGVVNTLEFRKNR